MAQAISPKDVGFEKAKHFPDFVLEEWNKMIAQKFTAGRARIEQDEMVAVLQRYTENGHRQEVFDSGWLNVEEVYREQGWKVEYDKPGYCESYAASFTFTAKG